MKAFISRDYYLQQLIDARENGFIKVITGIRRCGKSTLLQVLFRNYLLENNVSPDHIISINLDDRKNQDLRNPDTLLAFIRKHIIDNDLYFILMDEIQRVIHIFCQMI